MLVSVASVTHTGRVATIRRMFRVAVAFETPPVAVTTQFQVADTVGVPVMRPDDDIDSPVGSGPVVTA